MSLQRPENKIQHMWNGTTHQPINWHLTQHSNQQQIQQHRPKSKSTISSTHLHWSTNVFLEQSSEFHLIFVGILCKFIQNSDKVMISVTQFMIHPVTIVCTLNHLILIAPPQPNTKFLLALLASFGHSDSLTCNQCGSLAASVELDLCTPERVWTTLGVKGNFGHRRTKVTENQSSDHYGVIHKIYDIIVSGSVTFKKH